MTMEVVVWEKVQHHFEWFQYVGKTVTCRCEEKNGKWHWRAVTNFGEGRPDSFYADGEAASLQEARVRAFEAARSFLGEEVEGFGGKVTWEE